MLPDHSDIDFDFMSTSTVSPLAFDDGSSTYPHSAWPHGSIRTIPFSPSVCQSPIGESAGSSSTSCETPETRDARCGAGRTISAGRTGEDGGGAGTGGAAVLAG